MPEDTNSPKWGSNPGSKPDDLLPLIKAQHRQDNFNRYLDIAIAAVYILIVIVLKIWQPASVTSDILSLVTPIVFYLLGINRGKDKT